MEKKKILFVIDTYQTNNNGTSISAQRYAAQLRERGHEVRILCADEPESDSNGQLLPVEETQVYNVQEYVVPFFNKLIKKHGFYFGDIQERSQPVICKAVEWADIVHCYMPFALEMSASRYAVRIGKPCTAAFHIQPENLWSSVGLGKVQWIQDMGYQNFKNWHYYKFRHIHCVSQFMADTLLEHGYKGKLHVISNGIQEAFMIAGEKKKSIRRSRSVSESGLSSNSPKDGLFKIMMIGRLSQEKRQDVIINAVKYSKYADRIQLVFAGKGPEYDKYVELGKDLKHQPQFIYVNRDELIENLLDTDLYVHASDMESEAISCIEAFATGLVPVIANSHVSATPQFAIDGRSLFIPGDPKDLARAIDYWLDHPGERKYMEEQYRLAGRQYSLAASVEQFEQMLNEEIQENETRVTIEPLRPLRQRESLGSRLRRVAALF